MCDIMIIINGIVLHILNIHQDLFQRNNPKNICKNK